MYQLFSIQVDRQIYDDAVISKAVYWYTKDFVINRSANNNIETVTFQPKQKTFSGKDQEDFLQKFNQTLVDYKLRQIIEQETKEIRTILYVKAFSNSDDFEEYE